MLSVGAVSVILLKFTENRLFCARSSAYEHRANSPLKPGYNLGLREHMCGWWSLQLVSLTRSLSREFRLKGLKIGDIARATVRRTNIDGIFRWNQHIIWVWKNICVVGDVVKLYSLVTVCLWISFKKVLKFAILHVPFLRFTEVDLQISDDFQKAQTISFMCASRKTLKNAFINV